MAFLQDAQVFVDAGYDAGHGGLTGTGTACEYKVIVEVGGFESLFLTGFLYFYIVGQRTHLRLDGIESDEFVELFVWVALQGFVHHETVVLDTLFAVFLVDEFIFASIHVVAIVVIVEDEFLFLLVGCVFVAKNHGATR